MGRLLSRLASESGATLMVVLVAIVVTGLMAGVAGSSWKTVMQRAREAELLWRGEQYRSAIGSYYRGGQAGTQAQYPGSLEVLIKDPRLTGTVRHLRKLYPDPITGGAWILVKDASGRIRGVRSSSPLTPFRAKGFPPEMKDFAEASSYREWSFVYEPEKEDSQDG